MKIIQASMFHKLINRLCCHWIASKKCIGISEVQKKHDFLWNINNESNDYSVQCWVTVHVKCCQDSFQADIQIPKSELPRERSQTIYKHSLSSHWMTSRKKHRVSFPHITCEYSSLWTWLKSLVYPSHMAYDTLISSSEARNKNIGQNHLKT